HLTASDVSHALESGSLNAPGGYLIEQGQEAVIRIHARAQNAHDIGNVMVAMRGNQPVYVRDVASVHVGPAPPRGSASFGGKPAVIFSVVKQPQADTVSTTERVDAVLDAMAESLNARGISLHRDIFRQ